MKRVFLLALAFVFVMSMAVPVFAVDLEKSVDKLVDGTMEIMKSPIVLHEHTKATMDDAEHKPIGLLMGLIEAPFHMVKKAGGGLLDIVTFPIE